MKKHTFADESLGHSLLCLVSELLTTKTNGMAADALLRNDIVLFDVYWNKSKGERDIERLGQLESFCTVMLFNFHSNAIHQAVVINS